MILSKDSAELEAQLNEIEAVADEATPGPWMAGDRWHVQGASHCSCADRYGPLVYEGMMDINGDDMPAHVHQREIPWHPHGLYTPPNEDGEIFSVLTTTAEYGHPADEDLKLFALMNPETVKSLVEKIRELNAQVSDLLTNVSHETSST